jgi:transcriptional regulator GlxA family with amidase domain
VVDGNIWTISGGTAGLDGFLGFIEHAYDSETAQWVADMEEYAWHNDSTWDPYTTVWNVTATGQ